MRKTEIFALDFPCISISILQGSIEVTFLSLKMFLVILSLRGHFCMFCSYESIFIPEQLLFTGRSYRAVLKSHLALMVDRLTTSL